MALPMKRDEIHDDKDGKHTTVLATEERQLQNQDIELGTSRKSGVLNVFVSGMALFSDGYNAQISMNIQGVEE